VLGQWTGQMQSHLSEDMRAIPHDQWQAGLDRELAAWDKWFDAAKGGSDKDAAGDLAARLDPKFDVSQRDFLIPYLRPHNPPGSTVKVLDVGAGPLTAFPRNWITRTVEITAIDPLASRYDELLKQKNVHPIV